MSIKEDKLEEEIQWLCVYLSDLLRSPDDMPGSVKSQIKDVVEAIKELVNG